MKKLMFFAFAMAFGMMACTGNGNAAANGDADSIANDSDSIMTVDSISFDSAAVADSAVCEL